MRTSSSGQSRRRSSMRSATTWGSAMLVSTSWPGSVVSARLVEPRPFSQEIRHPAAERPGRTFVCDAFEELLHCVLDLGRQRGDSLAVSAPLADLYDRSDTHRYRLAETKPARADDRHGNDRYVRAQRKKRGAVLERHDLAVA